MPYQEVFFETFEPSGQHQVDFSGYMEFSDELVPGIINLMYDSMVLSDDKVGQLTDFSFRLEYQGLRTDQGNSIQINFLDPGHFFSTNSASSVRANDRT